MRQDLPVFCDWLKLRFRVDTMPERYERYVSCHTPDEKLWERLSWVSVTDLHHIGAFSGVEEVTDIRKSDATVIQAKYNPETGFLTYDGNLGRFGRGDNVWGQGVFASARHFLNRALAADRFLIMSPIEMRRVDLTCNLTFENASDAYAFLSWAGGVKLGRAQPDRYQTGVTWVTENWSAKVYDKMFDLKRHKLVDLAETISSEVGYLLRLELTLRTDELERLNVAKLDDWQNEDQKMSVIFTEKFKPLMRGGAVVDELVEEMPTRLSNAVEAWRNGRNFTAAVQDGRMSRATYYRLRKELLAFGIDISQPADVTRLRIQPREVPFQFVDAPSWYWNSIKRAA